jgi:hypothetical protein
MYVCRHLLLCRLEAKEVNLYTKKHLDTCGNDRLKHLIFWNGWSSRERREALLSVSSSMAKLETKNVMEVETSELVMVAQFFAAMRNLLDDSGFIAVVCKWWRQHMRSSYSYLLG